MAGEVPLERADRLGPAVTHRFATFEVAAGAFVQPRLGNRDAVYSGV